VRHDVAPQRVRLLQPILLIRFGRTL
jgi:hypothetical protein